MQLSLALRREHGEDFLLISAKRNSEMKIWSRISLCLIICGCVCILPIEPSLIISLVHEPLKMLQMTKHRCVFVCVFVCVCVCVRERQARLCVQICTCSINSSSSSFEWASLLLPTVLIAMHYAPFHSIDLFITVSFKIKMNGKLAPARAGETSHRKWESVKVVRPEACIWAEKIIQNKVEHVTACQRLYRLSRERETGRRAAV